MRLFINRVVQFVSRIDWVERIKHRVGYPGLGITDRVSLRVLGNFEYGTSCIIQTGANIIVPAGADLSLGDDCYIGRYVELGPGGCIRIGDGTSIQDRSIFVGDVTIGSYCSVSLGVLISSGRHHYDLYPSWLIKDQDKFVINDPDMRASHSRPVVIEDDCWLGINSVVMPGVKVGKGAVVGANSVVTKHVEPYTVVAGVPAKEIKKRLHFIPPRSIVYDNALDHPYFYSGFEISQDALERNSSLDGVLSKDEFTICLNASLGTMIYMVVRAITPNECNLLFGMQRQAISDQFEEVAFKINGDALETSRFCMKVDSKDAKLAIKKAWVA